jgi:DNA-binding MarR family transcriptional regulator
MRAITPRTGASLTLQAAAPETGAMGTIGPEAVGPVAVALEQVFMAAVGVTAVALNQARESQDLTVVQWRALVLLRSPGGLRVGELASGLGMSLPSASRLVTRLERRGLVRSERAVDDRRATVVTITDEGRRVRAAVVARRQALLHEALEGQGVTLPAGTEQGLAAVAEALRAYR